MRLSSGLSEGLESLPLPSLSSELSGQIWQLPSFQILQGRARKVGAWSRRLERT